MNTSSIEMYAIYTHTCTHFSGIVLAMNKAGQRLKSLRLRTGLSVRDFASKLDMPFSTYSGYENRSKKPFFKHEFVEKLIPLFERYGITEKEVMELARSSDGVKDINVSYRVLGYVQAGTMSEAIELPYDDQQTVYLPTGEHPNAHDFFVLRARGDSMNKVGITDGAYIICLDRHKYNHAPETGDLVIAQRTDGHGQYETTLKELEIKPDGSHWLWPRSDNPEHQQPFRIRPMSEWPDSLDQCSAEEFFVSAIVMSWMPALSQH